MASKVALRGLANHFAIAVPNCANGGNTGFSGEGGATALVSIAKHWGFSL
jgi:hypothetical protein